VSTLWTRFVPHFGLDRLLEHRLLPIPDEGKTLRLGQTELELVPAHFLHSPGNFHVWDPTSRILYSGDLGASLGVSYREVTDFDAHVPSMEPFHRRYMTSRRAMQAWVRRVRDLDIQTIAPQHGALFRGRELVERFIAWCDGLECGVDLLA
jgi:flavorubredoxin